jgi:hypothetical protein
MQIQALNAVKNITIMTTINLPFNVRNKEVINADKGTLMMRDMRQKLRT